MEITYSDLVKFSNDDSEEYNIAKEYILSPKSRKLTDVGKNAIIKAAKPSENNFTIYRADDTNWLSKYKVGDVADTYLYLSGSLDKDLVIPENKENVKQKLVINIKKGDNILVPNNGEEQEVSVVKTKEGHGIKITNIEKDSDGTPVYTVDVYQ